MRAEARLIIAGILCEVQRLEGRRWEKSPLFPRNDVQFRRDPAARGGVADALCAHRDTHRAGSQVIKAIVPLAEMFGYATHMRSSTQGRAEYSMHFARYEEVPRSAADEIIGRAQGNKR